MTTREARAELKQVIALKCRINARKRRIEELRCSVQNARISRYGASGGAKDNDKLERTIDALTKIERQLLAEIEEYERLRSEIVAKIDRVPYPYGTYLTERFVFGKSFATIWQMREFERYAYGGIRALEVRAIEIYRKLQ